MDNRSWNTPLTRKGILVLLGIASASDASAQKACTWAAPVNLGPEVNSAATDQGPVVSRDGRSLYFVSTRPGGFGGADIWVTERKNRNKPWGTPINLGPTINTAGNDATPALSRDGMSLYFATTRPGGFGGNDIWVSQRSDKKDNLAWETPVNIGAAVNGPGAELGPSPVETRGGFTLYFYSIRPGSLLRDLYYSTRDENGEYGAPVPVDELNTPFEDERPFVTKDGRMMLFDSNRPGGLGGSDIYISTRERRSEVWSAPVNLGSEINTPLHDGRPALSADGKYLFFHSDGRGGSGTTDLFVAERHCGWKDNSAAQREKMP